MPLYKAASNYLLYGRIVRGFGGHWHYLETERDILRAYVGAYEDLSRLFIEVEPDVIFYDTIDRISNYIAFALALHHNTFALDFRLSPMGEAKITSGFGLFRKNLELETLYARRAEITATSYAAADQILENSADYLRHTLWARTHRKMLSANSPFNPRWLKTRLASSAGVVRGVTNFRWHVRSVTNRLWLARHLDTELPNAPYIVVPLHRMPEVSTSSQAPRWVYLDAIVEQLAINAPSGLKIVVKEHPRGYGSRGVGFFKPLQNLPNVILCHPSVDSLQLISHAEAVVAISGTAGLEGILLGKRVGVLGRPFYSFYPGVKTLSYPEEIYPALSDPSWKPSEMLQERRDFVAAYIQSLHDFAAGPQTELYPESGGEKWAQTLREIMRFVERHDLRVTDFDSGLPFARAGTAHGETETGCKGE